MPEGFGCLFISCPHGREKQYVSDRGRIGQKHDQTVDTNTQAACWRQTIFQSGDEIFIHWMSFVVALGFFLYLFAEAFLLIDRIIELRESIGMLTADDVELKTIGQLRIAFLAASKGRL